MINLDEALEPIREMIENERYDHDGAYQANCEENDRTMAGSLTSDEVSRILRLDWELAEGEHMKSMGGAKNVAKLMVENLKVDLEDLIENGDEEQSHDALLKLFNGSKKRGKEVKKVVILGAHIERLYREKKKTYEYTLFIRPYIKWGTNDSELAVQGM